MGKHKKREKQSDRVEKSDDGREKPVKDYSKISLYVSIIAIIISVVISLMSGMYYMGQLQANSDYQSKDINKLEEEVDELRKLVINQDKKMAALSTRMDDSNGLKTSAISLTATLGTIKRLTIASEDRYNFQNPEWGNNEIIAEDKNGKKYKAKDLYDKPVILSYKENGYLIVFYGQFNDKNHWDGPCVINTYKDDKLYLISETNYIDGQSYSYNEVLSDDKLWHVLHVEKIDNYHLGESKRYYKKQEYTKKFKIKSISSSDVITINKFENSFIDRSLLEGYYSGEIKDGKYNDDTGNAYLIKFTDKGFVEFLYNGNFVDGYPEDDTNKAWSLFLDKKAKQYIYYKGDYSNGKKTDTSPKSNKYISITKIKSLISNKEYNIKLKWYEKTSK